MRLSSDWRGFDSWGGKGRPPSDLLIGVLLERIKSQGRKGRTWSGSQIHVQFWTQTSCWKELDLREGRRLVVYIRADKATLSSQEKRRKTPDERLQWVDCHLIVIYSLSRWSWLLHIRRKSRSEPCWLKWKEQDNHRWECVVSRPPNHDLFSF